MKFQGIVLLCCVLLVKGQVPASDNSDEPKTTTPGTTTSTSTTTATTTTTKEPETTTPPATTTSTPGTTTPKPSTTPSPAVPDYPKNVGKWSVEDSKNTSCITLKGAIQIVVVINENKTETVNVPPNSESTGNCNVANEKQLITLRWESTIPNLENTLSFTFESNATKENSVGADTGITLGKYGLQKVKAVLYFESGNVTEQVQKIAAFQTPFNHSYSCLAEEVIKSENASLTLKVRDIQVEAFRLTPPGHREFSAAIQCPADDATDVVPIAVGAALAGLVVIVLIAYLIGRKRSRARGYQSV